ncbi:hypothetical protein BH23PLA1_BH23PLA1_39010 [soil metagenome]
MDDGLLAIDTGFLPPGAGTFDSMTLSVATPLIQSIRFRDGGAAFSNSVFYDNLTVSAFCLSRQRYRAACSA